MTMLRFVDEQINKDVASEKKEMRARMKTRRANNENRDVKERLLVENTLQVLEGIYKDCNANTINVFCYLSYSSEAPTDLLVEELVEKGYNVFCPRVEGEKMVAARYGEDLALSTLRIREPIGEAFNGEMHVAIVPFLAVDKQGRRLGYGGGYYDRYFADNPDTIRVAFGFDFQVQPKVPTEETDKPMHCIVTDKDIYLVQDIENKGKMEK